MIIFISVLFFKEVVGNGVNLALNKPSYVGEQKLNTNREFYVKFEPVYEKYEKNKKKEKIPHNFSADMQNLKWLVIDLEGWYQVTSINLSIKSFFCEKRINFSVGLLIEFNGTHLSENKFCGQLTDEIKIKKTYTLQCNKPHPVTRFVSVFVEDDDVDMGLIELEVFGENRKISLKNYLGCYKNNSLTSQSTPSPPDRCINHCLNNNFMFFILKESKCFCTNDPGVKVVHSSCDVTCSGGQLFCGSNLNYYSVYLTNVCVDSKHMEVSCDQRDCSVDNGGCGELNCVEETVEGFPLSGCVCGEGYEESFNSTECFDLNECEEGFDRIEKRTCRLKKFTEMKIPYNIILIVVCLLFIGFFLLVGYCFIIKKVSCSKLKSRKKQNSNGNEKKMVEESNQFSYLTGNYNQLNETYNQRNEQIYEEI